MPAILSILAVIGSAVWYYQTAYQRQLPAVAWAIAGALIYYMGFLLWMHGIIRTLMGGSFQTHGLWSGIGMDLTAIVFGGLCVVAFRQWVLCRKGTPVTPP
ncbi:MAG: hypothetical protein RIQ52_2091 [Pseudomonadota bacterium]|jgi:hypothetical protein